MRLRRLLHLIGFDNHNKIVGQPNRLKTRNLTLVPHVPDHLLALIESSEAYEKRSGMYAADCVREFLLAGSPDFQTQLQAATAPDPWEIGFAVVHDIENIVIGMCRFAGLPDSNGVAEIAYSIAPVYQGKGYATEVASPLIDYASSSGGMKTVCAHRLPEINASTQVLEKCGFKKVAEIVDSEIIWSGAGKEESGRASTCCGTIYGVGSGTGK